MVKWIKSGMLNWDAQLVGRMSPYIWKYHDIELRYCLLLYQSCCTVIENAYTVIIEHYCCWKTQAKKPNEFTYMTETSTDLAPFPKVVSIHLWNTPLNLYQGAIGRDFFHKWRTGDCLSGCAKEGVC